MAIEFLLHTARRFKPRYGWLPYFLLLSTLVCLILSVLEVEWVSDDGVIIPTVLIGFILAAILAQRPVHPAVAWIILAICGLLLTIILVADLIPPLTLSGNGWETLLDYWRLRSALFIDRTGGWLRAVSAGDRSTETVVFTLLLSLFGWLVAAALAWSAYRVRLPYVGLTFAGLALAANTFYGGANLYWVLFFFTLTMTAATYLNYLYREIDWERSGIDYSAEIRQDLLLYVAGVSLGVGSVAMSIPLINFRAIAEAFQQQEAVVEAEQTLARAFAGVQQPRSDEGAISAGGLPRSFLLGDDPELTETVVMTATLRAGPDFTPDHLAAQHWRSISYDIYTGRGWTRSPEREEHVDAGQPISQAGWQPAADARVITIEQDINWIYDRRATRYTLGRPVVFSHDLITLWRGRDDFVGLRSRNNAPGHYTAQSQIIQVAPDQLRTVQLDEMPPEIRARYTSLPDDLPDRVRELAFQVAGVTGGEESPSPYDQARAIESFLHQYPYSLDIGTPPADVDIVDHFLFDLQTGFCDYYASAMVVMARAVGLPARLGVGFMQAPANAAGVQTIRQIDAHSWAEVYFTGYGWVEFEPTAPFAGAAAPVPPAPGATASQPTFEPPTSVAIAIPDRAPQRSVPWALFLGLAILALVGWRLWGGRLAARRRASQSPLDDVQRAYGQLQDSASTLGLPPHPSQTPAEFASEVVAAPAIVGPEGAEIGPRIERLAQIFTAHTYGRDESAALGQEAQAIWATLRDPLRRLIWRRRLGRRD